MTKGQELLKDNPKAASFIHDYYLNMMLDALEDDNLPENFKEFAREKGMPLDNISAMIDANPRGLFDVFDLHNICINVTTSTDTLMFSYSIMTELATIKSDNVFDTRKEADKSALETAITMLEKKLNSLEKTNEDS